MKEVTKTRIEEILRQCISSALKRTVKNKVHRPFHESLLSKEYVNASSFERSFSTSFGQGPVEEISRLIAIDAGYEAERQKQTYVNLYKGAIDEVERICSNLRSGETKPDWERETAKLQAYSKGDTIVRRVIFRPLVKKGRSGNFHFHKNREAKPGPDGTCQAGHVTLESPQAFLSNLFWLILQSWRARA